MKTKSQCPEASRAHPKKILKKQIANSSFAAMAACLFFALALSGFGALALVCFSVFALSAIPVLMSIPFIVFFAGLSLIFSFLSAYFFYKTLEFAFGVGLAQTKNTLFDTATLINKKNANILVLRNRLIKIFTYYDKLKNQEEVSDEEDEQNTTFKIVLKNYVKEIDELEEIILQRKKLINDEHFVYISRSFPLSKKYNQLMATIEQAEKDIQFNRDFIKNNLGLFYEQKGKSFKIKENFDEVLVKYTACVNYNPNQDKHSPLGINFSFDRY